MPNGTNRGIVVGRFPGDDMDFPHNGIFFIFRDHAKGKVGRRNVTQDIVSLDNIPGLLVPQFNFVVVTFSHVGHVHDDLFGILFGISYQGLEWMRNFVGLAHFFETRIIVSANKSDIHPFFFVTAAAAIIVTTITTEPTAS
jgi:hypothetical protein